MLKNGVYNNNFNNITNKITTITNNTFKKFSRQAISDNDSQVFLASPPVTYEWQQYNNYQPWQRSWNHFKQMRKLHKILNDHTTLRRGTAEISSHLLYLEDKLKDLAPSNHLSTKTLITSCQFPVPDQDFYMVFLQGIICFFSTFDFLGDFDENHPFI